MRVRSVNLCVFVYWKGSEGGPGWLRNPTEKSQIETPGGSATIKFSMNVGSGFGVRMENEWG